MDEVSLPIAALYSELHDLSADDDEHRREGGYSVKRIRGHRYWYHQIWVGSRRVQKAVGRETPELLEKISVWRAEAERWRAQMRRRKQLVRSLKAALSMTTDPLTGKVIERLSELRVFSSGAILIGTHAYSTYGPMLGVRTARANLRTSDIDFGAVNVATEDVQVSFADAVQSVDNAFFIVPSRPGSRISTALKYRGGSARVELLTPLGNGKPWQPEVIKSLQFGAQRTPYLDYLIEESVEATYLFGAGVRVSVPHPARYAWHKLIVAANRDASAQTKALKDVAQANELLKALLISRTNDVKRSAKTLIKHGSAYVRKARASASKLDDDLKRTALEFLEAR